MMIEMMQTCGPDRSLPSVPRSKGCGNCVARKTRCDGRRPTCRTCEKRKQECPGYRRDEVVFLSEGWRSLGVSSDVTVARKQARRRTPPTPPTPPQVNDNLTLACLSTPGSIYDSQPHISYFRASFGNQPSQSLGSISHLFGQYLDLLASNNDNGVQHHPSTTSSLPVVLAVDALAHCHFGTAHADQLSVQRGLRSYGKAVESMSISLDDMMKRGEAGLQNLSEEEWQHFAFFCLVMAFWEMKMSPQSRNWENHVRCLATAIVIRGADHAWSSTNFRLLASSRLLLMLQALSAREPRELHQSLPVRTAWLGEVHSALGGTDHTKAQSAHELYDSLDSLMVEATSVGSIMAQFDSLLARISESTTVHPEDATVLLQLYHTAERLLTRNEARLAIWNANICEIKLSTWLSTHQDVLADPTSGRFLSRLSINAIKSDFETVLTFRSLLEYNSITTCWTIIMTLRLLLSDMLALMVQKQIQGIPRDAKVKIEGHRTNLMGYALRVLKTVCYATSAESRAVAPFAFVTAFQLSVAVLDRECHSLQVANDKGDDIARCKSLKIIALSYLEWAVQNMIPVKIDLDSPRTWKLNPVG